MDKFLDNKKIKMAVAVVLSIVITYVIINFIPFDGMLDEFKVSFKTSTMEDIVKYYSLTIATIVLAIYIALYFVSPFINIVIDVTKEHGLLNKFFMIEDKCLHYFHCCCLEHHFLYRLSQEKLMSKFH